MNLGFLDGCGSRPPLRSPVARPGSRNRASKWRGESDFYPTPAGVTQALCDLKILPGLVWEPACGDGAMARVLCENGHNVYASDLHFRGYGIDRYDFLEQSGSPNPMAKPDGRAHAIVTNPPFNLANEFVAHALSLRPDMVAMFLRLKFLEGRRRYDGLLREQPPSDIYVFIERVKFFSGDHSEESQPGWNTEAFAWFVWKRDVFDPPRIHWISRGAS